MKLLREPLLHFLAMGGVLFAAHAALRPGGETAISLPTVRITTVDADWLREMWARQWRRPPTDEELSRLVTDYLKEEVLAREARALAMDVGDIVVRRRLAQKMAFLFDDTIRTADPPETELRALYEMRPELVRAPARVSFTQAFFRREHGDERARASLLVLSDSSNAAEEHGDRLLLGDTFVDQEEQALINLFGVSFAKAVLALPIGRWSGPIESGYGLHLVKVTAVSPPEPRSFAEVRGSLVEEWRRERQVAAQEQLLRGLMRKHRVVVDPAVRPFLGPLAEQVEIRP